MRLAALLVFALLAACGSSDGTREDPSGDASPDGPPDADDFLCDRTVSEGGRLAVYWDACMHPSCTAGTTPCPGPCEALDEQTCLDTPGCRPTYEILPPLQGWYRNCRSTSDPGPIAGLDCESASVDECARSDECAIVYAPGPAGDTVANNCSPVRLTGAELCNGDPDCQIVCGTYCGSPDDASYCTDSSPCGGPDPTCGSSCNPYGANPVCNEHTTPEACDAANCYSSYVGTNCVCNPVHTCHCETWTFACN